MSSIDKFNFFWQNIRRVLTQERFALAPIWVQLIAIFIVSATLIIGLSPFLGSLANSYKIFADPAYYADAKGPIELTVGLIQVMVGMILFSFIISVLSAALVNLIENIKSGSLPYRKRGHILFVNYNIKLPLILDQFNIRAKDKGIIEDVVLLFAEAKTVGFFRSKYNKDRWENLEIFIRQGEVMSFHSFERLSIFHAKALVILLPDNKENEFIADNFNLKILTTLTNNQAFFNHLNEKQASRKPIKCSIELSNHSDARKIALELTSNKSGSLFTVITPGDVIGSILARSKVDIVYYKVFFEVLAFDGSTIHFVDPKQFGSKQNFVGMSFEQLLFSFSGGTLMGFSRSNNEGYFQINLCPFKVEFSSNDWFLFLTPNVREIKYVPQDYNPQEISTNSSIISPNEEASKKICVIGSAWTLENIDDFIDLNSLISLHESQKVFSNPAEYFSNSFLQYLHEGNFDNIIINLEDELGFRLTMLLISANKDNPIFLSKIMTILGDPVTERLLSNNVLKSNTVLSHKLSARYIAQLSFQKNLDRLFQELAFTEGSEFNLLEVDKHIPSGLLTDVKSVRKLLAAHEMVYLGTVDEEKNVNLEATDFKGTKQILVLSFGKYKSKVSI
ncbi:hypothetical protein [Shivajiella indica]|uniref:Uncharacterized protein n=1 Tax=Shivajiella indica TaxID=872115 RepID=A0ABW5BBG1_9BACT